MVFLYVWGGLREKIIWGGGKNVFCDLELKMNRYKKYWILGLVELNFFVWKM